MKIINKMIMSIVISGAIIVSSIKRVVTAIITSIKQIKQAVTAIIERAVRWPHKTYSVVLPRSEPALTARIDDHIKKPKNATPKIIASVRKRSTIKKTVTGKKK